MKITPNSTLYLLKNVPLDINNNYTIDFKSIEAQSNFFDNLIDNTFDINEGYSYIRDTQTLKVQANIDDLFGINYLYYKNNGKRYYAFITKKDYINPNCTALSFKIDVLQSFMFDYEIDESFVEREHQDRFTQDLKPKINDVPENLTYGENYKLVKVENVLPKRNRTAKKLNIKWAIIICSDKLTEDSIANASSLDSYYYYACPFESPETQALPRQFYYRPTTSSTDITSLERAYIMTKIVATKNASKIVSIKLYENSPFECYMDDYGNDNVIISGGFVKVVKIDNYNFLNVMGTIEKTIQGNDSLRELNTLDFNLENDVVLDINNQPNISYETKLLNDPYYFIQLTNHNGEGLKIKLVGLKNINKIPIYYIPVCSPDSKIMYYIKGYYGDEEGRFYNYIDNTINEIPLTSDKWQEYLAINKASATAGVAVNLASSVATTAIGAISGNPLAIAGGVLSLGQNIANTIIKQEDIKQSPNSVKSQGNNAGFTLVRQLGSIELEHYSITDTAKSRLFNYFFHYGYKCNDFKKPNIKSRYYFNYIKTIGANIKSNIDNDFISEIESIFNNGITFWHYREANTFKGVNNYNYENVEINLMEVN